MGVGDTVTPVRTPGSPQGGTRLTGGSTFAREWRGPDSNRRHPGFQPSALPAELPRPDTYGTAATSLAGGGRHLHSREALDERVEELALLQNGVCTRVRNRLVKAAVGVARERDQAEVGVVSAQPRDGGHAVDERHVQVDHDCIRMQLVRE